MKKIKNWKFIIKYLDKEINAHIKNLMISILNIKFLLKEADTCIISKLEKIFDDKK